MNKKNVAYFVMTLFIATATFSALSCADEEVTSSFAEVLDQSQTWEDTCQYVGGSEWQEFIPTLDNLNRVEVKVAQWFGGSPDMEVTIEKPLGNVLTFRKMAASSIPSGSCDWVSFNVPDITLVPGESYYLRVIAPIGSEYGWGFASNNLYGAGTSSQAPGDWCFKTFGYSFPTIPGLKFSYVYFNTIDQQFGVAPGWGHLEVDIDELTSHFQMNEGYLNVYTNNGWVIANMYINKVEGMEELSTYFQLGGIMGKPGESTFSAHIDLDDSPEETFGEGDITYYTLESKYYNSEGLGLEARIDLSEPPIAYEYIPFEPYTWDFTKPLRRGENVQAARNQCAPMGIANSLQYLENTYSSISVPHNHVAGQDGDSSLVGQLDEDMARSVTSRTSGSGCNCPQILEGKFEYLDNNGLKDKLVNKHQGYGYFGMTAGDYTSHGITSEDESVGGKVTFDWIREQLEKCEDVEVGISWGGGGGHMVRIYGCGETFGMPYLRYAHDSIQAYPGAGGTVLGDDVGLECAQVYVSDLDGDGMMNWGSRDDEIVFAMSESPKRLRIVDIRPFVGIALDVENEGEEDEIVNWEIDINASFMILGKHKEGEVEIPGGETETITTGLILGFGPGEVSIKINDEEDGYGCFILGPFVLGMDTN